MRSCASVFRSLLLAVLALGPAACGSSDDDTTGAAGHGALGGAGNAAGHAGASGSGAAAAGRGTGGTSGAGATSGAGGGTSGSAGATAGAAGRGGASGGGAGTNPGGSGGSPAAGTSSDGGAGGESPGDSGGWVLGYWAVWQNTQYPLEHVKWSAMTHAALSFVLPRAPVAPSTQSPYATLDTSNVVANLGASGMADFAAAAHAGGAKALVSLGGGGSGEGFKAAASAANREQLISEVLAACSEWDFDGVDLDWEDSIDFPSFKALVADLRAAAPPGFLITVPIGSVNNNLGIDSDSKDLWVSSQEAVDQLNVMTYVGSGNYPGWVVWYLSPLHGAGSDHPFDVASTLTAWSALGIPKSKLGLGVGFYGRAVGPPVAAALEDYGDAEVYENDTTLSHGSIMGHFIDQGGAEYHFDESAMAPYLSWPAAFTPSWSSEFPGDAAPTVQFLTYEDEAGIAAKGAWAKENGYGGAIIWTINEGVRYPYSATNYANPLLDAVSDAFR